MNDNMNETRKNLMSEIDYVNQIDRIRSKQAVVTLIMAISFIPLLVLLFVSLYTFITNEILIGLFFLILSIIIGAVFITCLIICINCSKKVEEIDDTMHRLNLR